MVGLGTSISHIVASCDYAKNQKELLIDPNTGKEYRGELASMEVDRNLISGDTAHEIAGDFRIFQRGSTIKNTMFSFVISPQKEIGDSFSADDWRDLTRDFLQRIGAMVGVENIAEKQAYIAYLHSGSKSRTKHLHVYMNRVLPNQKPITDKFIGNKSSKVCTQICNERGYKTAQQVRKEKEKLQNMEPEAIHIKESIDHVFNNYPKNLDDFVAQLEKCRVTTIKKYDSKNKLRGLSFNYQNQKYKATIFHRSYSGNKIQQTITRHYKSRKKEIQLLRKKRKNYKQKGFEL